MNETTGIDEARKLAWYIEEAIRDGAAAYWKDAREGKGQGDLPSYIIRAVLAVLPNGKV